MPSKQDDAALLWDMLDCARSVMQMVGGMAFEQYVEDRRTRRAVEREIEIIGEAARGLSDELQIANPHVPWRKVMGQRHRLAHEYGEIVDEIIWRVATVHVPALIAQLEPLLPPPPPASPETPAPPSA